jgi:hypothetical protein
MANDFEGGSRGPGVVGIMLPFATALGAAGVGLLVGGIIGWVAKPAREVTVEVPRDLTADELLVACRPQVEEKAQEVVAVNNKVNALESTVRAKEARVTELETEMQKRNERGAAIMKELEAARAELVTLRAELQTAKAEKVRLEQELQITVAKLEETEVALADQKQMTERAKEDALVNKYERFKNDAQLEICEKGNRKKLGKCREAVIGYLSTDDMRDKFSHCVRSGQAVPSVFEMKEKDSTLPAFAGYLNQEDKIVKDWYLLLCDPTLPESDGFLNEEHLPKPAEPAPAGGVGAAPTTPPAGG